MSNKIKVTKENYKELMLKRAIILCWILLGICLVIKIFNNKLFNISSNNERFVSFCDKVDKSFIRYIIYYITFIYTSLMLLLITKPEIISNKKKIFLYILTISFVWIFKFLVDTYIININLVLYNIIILLTLFVILLLFTGKLVTSVIVELYDFTLSLLSSLLKNISLTKGITESFLVNTIFLIDYYIALTLTVLYRESKRR